MIGDRLNAERELMKEDVFDERTVQGVASRLFNTERCVIMKVPQGYNACILMNELTNWHQSNWNKSYIDVVVVESREDATDLKKGCM